MENPTRAAAQAAVDDTVIARDHDCFPPLLREIHDPPDQLYVRGDPRALLRPQLAIVGSRRASLTALKLTELLARQLARAGFSICSGLALGIDGAAHRGALEAGGITVAVTGTGVDRIYPPQHRELGKSVTRSGCMVSELPPGSPPRAHHFPRRNRLISGMCVGVMVVEAAQRSGSLITARLAMEQGREVFALPWSLLHAGGQGCLELIRDGARMVLSIEDVLGEVAPLAELTPALDAGQGVAVESPAEELSSREERLLALIGDEPCSLDDLAAASGWSAQELSSRLSALEIAGLIVREGGRYLPA
jgi:DNA processing protein